MLGKMVADATGFHGECTSATQTARLAAVVQQQQHTLQPEHLSAFPLCDWITKKPYSTGQISDDSQTMLALMEAYRFCSVEDIEAIHARFARNLVGLFQHNFIAGYGKTTHQAVQKLQQGFIWQKSGGTRVTNGGAMRVAPLGVLLQHDIPLLLQRAALQCAVTHTHPLCVASACLVALAAAMAAQHPALTTLAEKQLFVSHLFHTLTPFARSQNWAPEVLEAYTPLQQLVATTPAEATQQIYALNTLLTPEKNTHFGIGTHPVPTVLWSIYCFLHQPNSYWSAVAQAIAIGGDTDTVAAITGSLCGAYGSLPHNSAWVPATALIQPLINGQAVAHTLFGVQ